MEKRHLTTAVLALLALTAVGARLQQAPPGGQKPAPVRTGARPGDGQGASAGSAEARARVSLDQGWRFSLGSASDLDRDFGFGGDEAWSKLTSWGGPARQAFNDAGWRELDLPHDWAVELSFVQEPASAQLLSHGFKPVGRAFPDRSIGWYRKQFAVAAAAPGSRFSIEFDGVFRDCYVWLNGALLGRHEGGYAPFAFDATDLIETGGQNLLTVRVDATQAEGWFYEGAGIYRHVWLVKTPAVHFARGGVFVTGAVNGARATLTVESDIVNDSDRADTARLETRVIDPAGRTVATLPHDGVDVAAWGGVQLRQSTVIEAPVLWSLERPALYRVVSTVRSASNVADQVTTRAGIRTIRFDPDKGFFLNGRHVPINGVCNHQDHAGVGAAVPDRLQRYRLERLKDMGVNALRTAHNPPAAELLDACDELGILVMDETRLFSSSALSLEQLRAMVLRDRNHPSVILWSIGNEEPAQATPRGHRIAATMIRAVKALDASRPVTYASNSGAYAGVNELVDVRGFNYHVDQVDQYHQAHPTQPLLLSEIASTLTTRGEYAVDKAKGYMSAYDRDRPSWGQLAGEWMTFLQARPWLAGGFVWTGFDYRGEPTPYEWPCISSHFGVLDTCGFSKDLFWYYKSWWTSDPVLHLLPHWNWRGREGQPIDVWAFTNVDQVRLSLNGRDLGTRAVERFGHAAWQVPYEPGRLEAVGFVDGREVLRAVVETTGDAARIALAADRPRIDADRRDLSVVTVSALDAGGRAVPVADADVSFEVTGPGRVIGVGNGDPSSHEADTFVVTPVIQRIDRWRAAPLDGEPGRMLTVSDLESRGGRRVGVNVDAADMPPDSTWAYWTTFQLRADRLGGGMTTLTLGQVSGTGRVYLNGRLLGETHDGGEPQRFNAAGILSLGQNDLVVIVSNKQGHGGIGRGVFVSGARLVQPPHRRLFNGLAQVIVQSTGEPGPIILKATAEGLDPATITIDAGR